MKRLFLTLSILLLFGRFGGYGTTFAQRDYPNRQREYRQYILVGDGVTDDTEALNAWGRGERVIYQGRVLGNLLQNGTFLISWKVDFNRRNSVVRFNTFVWKYRGYDRTDWINHDWKVRYYSNKVIDVGMGDSPYRRKKRNIILRLPIRMH